MAASYIIHTPENVKYVRISGTTNYRELEALFYEYVRDPEFRPDMRILADLREMTDAVAGLLEILRLKKLYQYAYRDAVGAVDVVIVAKKGIAYRAARTFKLFMFDRKPLNILITQDLGHAQEILGLSNYMLAQMQQETAATKAPTLKLVP
jgi:hypothetical protein